MYKIGSIFSVRLTVGNESAEQRFVAGEEVLGHNLFPVIVEPYQLIFVEIHKRFLISFVIDCQLSSNAHRGTNCWMENLLSATQVISPIISRNLCR